MRIEGGRVLATLIRFTGEIGLAEDALQDAVVVALQQWPRAGTPRYPAGWLLTTARNKALDRIRREAARGAKERLAVFTGPSLDPVDGVAELSLVADDPLRLIFTCCHPALAAEARVALALRTIARLRTSEIAAVFLVSETTMAARLTRAKKKIAAARIPYRVPADHELPDRLPAVLAVVYAIFTAGHHPGEGDLEDRFALADEGVRLARLLDSLMPDEPECGGLLSLLLATHARRRARVSIIGDVVLLEDQDRSLWDRSAIGEAHALVERTLRRRRVGPYQVQAAIACLHGLAACFDDTDWPQIAELYSVLERMQPSVAVRVNGAVAAAYADGPHVGLELLRSIDLADVAGWHLYWSTRSELERRAGLLDDARASIHRALACDMNDSDRRLLLARRRSLD